MSEATIFQLAIGFGTVALSVGGAWGLMQSGITRNSDDIAELKKSRSTMWEQVNEQGKTLARIDGKVDILVQREEN